MPDYQSRRKKLVAVMQDHDIFVMFSGCSDTISILPDGGKGVDPNFYYLTGCYENGLILVMIKSGDQVSETLLVPQRSEMEAFYMGVAKDREYYRQRTGFVSVDYTCNLDSIISMQAFCCRIRRICIACPNKTVLTHATQEAAFVHRMLDSFPHAEIVDLHGEIVRLRHVKDADEIAAIQKAVDLTGEAILAVMRDLRPGMKEYQASAIAEYAARMNGAESIPEQVIANAENAVILHYEANDGVFGLDDMVMLDLCTSYRHYHSDITRCYPISGRFTERQAYWYNVVLQAQEMTVAKMKPGANPRECGAEARAFMAEELIKQGYIRSPEEVSMMIGQCRRDYVTCAGVNHCIGLETDETENEDLRKALVPGSVYTVEPGVYLGSENLGIRIEDDYLVTEEGTICLSRNIPKTVEEIEETLRRIR